MSVRLAVRLHDPGTVSKTVSKTVKNLPIHLLHLVPTCRRTETMKNHPCPVHHHHLRNCYRIPTMQITIWLPNPLMVAMVTFPTELILLFHHHQDIVHMLQLINPKELSILTVDTLRKTPRQADVVQLFPNPRQDRILKAHPLTDI